MPSILSLAPRGDLDAPTADEKAAFAAAAEPVQGWFRENVDGGDQILDSLIEAVGEAEAELAEDYASDLN